MIERGETELDWDDSLPPTTRRSKSVIGRKPGLRPAAIGDALLYEHDRSSCSNLYSDM
jgi:hypothetical protein